MINVPPVDTRAAVEWIRRLHRDTGGYVGVNSADTADGGPADWSGRFYDLTDPGADEAIARYIATRDQAGATGIYVGQASVLHRPDPGERTKVGQVHRLAGLWIDGDTASPAHKHVTCPGGVDCTHERPHRTVRWPLPADADAVWAVVAEAGLSAPTVMQVTGNGVYGHWLLDEARTCTGGKAGAEAKLSERLHRQLQAAAARLKLHYGPLGDLARVLRLPGTLNRKPGTPGGAVLSEVIAGGTDRPYGWPEMLAMVEAAEARTARATPRAPAARERLHGGPTPPVGASGVAGVDRPRLVQDLSPIDDFNRRADWLADILEPAGWQLAMRVGPELRVTRPGKDVTAGWSATVNGTGADTIHVFSSDAHPFEADENYTKAGAWRELHHGGADGDPTWSATNRDLRARGYGDELPARDRPATDLTPPDGDLWAVVDDPGDPSPAVRRPTVEEEFVERQRMVKRAQRQVEAEEEQERAEQRKIRLTPASEFRLKAVKWVWEGRMPLGEITLVPGREGAGKSTFLAWMAAAVTRGQLPGMHFERPRAVLYAATEDSWEYTIAPRLVAAGADMDLVYRIDVQEVDAGRFGKLSMPVDNRALIDAAHEVKAAMLMCDPIISIIDDKINTFKAQELRGALEPLKRAAEEAEIALVGLVHFNKTKDTDVLSMISGSRAWAEVARAVVAIAVDRDAEEYTCVVSQVKNNLGRSDLPHLKYTIRSAVLRAADHPAADEDVEIGRLEWTGESEQGVEDLLTVKPAGTPTGDVTNAVVAFITERHTLSGRVPMSDISERFGDTTPENLRKVLSRCVNRGALKRPARGFYEPGADKPRSCPSCAKPMNPGENFCRRCAQQLDGADRHHSRQFEDGW
jgi:hypothetical protein